MTILVHQTKPASPSVAGWFQALLTPVVVACKITTALPVELRPTGAWGGWCSRDLLGTPDRRICVSSRAVLWTKERFVLVYIHETAHRLLLDVGAAHFNHDSVFFALQMVMLLRLDGASYKADEMVSSWEGFASFYDLQDPPECWDGRPRHSWLPRCLSWSMTVASELAESQLTAEQCGSELARRYENWTDGLAKEPAIKAAAAAGRQKKQDAVKETIYVLRKKTRQRGWVAGIFAVMFVFTFYKYINA